MLKKEENKQGRVEGGWMFLGIERRNESREQMEFMWWLVQVVGDGMMWRLEKIRVISGCSSTV